MLKRFLIYLILVSLLLPNVLSTEAKTTSMSERIAEVLAEMQLSRNELFKGSEENTLIPEDPLFLEVKGEKIPYQISKLLPNFQEGKVEVFILLNDPPVIEQAQSTETTLDLYLKDPLVMEKAQSTKTTLDSPSMLSYKENLANTHTRLLSSARRAGIKLNPKYEFFYTLNGFYAEVPISDLSKLRVLPNVKEVQYPTIYETNDRYALDIIRAPIAWSTPYNVKGEGQVIAIVDTGVDYRHPDLGGGFGAGFKVIGGYDFGGDETWGVGDPDPMDRHGHGTHVAGIAAAKPATATGVSGVAPEAKIVAYKIVFQNEGFSVCGAIAVAFEHMVTFVGPAGERVTSANLSFGAVAGFYDAADPSETAMNNAVRAGIFVAGSAGNRYSAHYQFATRSSTGRDTIYPADIGTTVSPNTAALVMSVGASNTRDDSRYSFTSWGLTPGMGPKPEITAPGSLIYSTDLVTHASTTYSSKEGTSMASPYVAGAGALVKQYRPTLTPLMIKQALVNTAIINTAGGNTYRGSARIQGGGRIDIPRALEVPALLSGVNGEVFLSYGDTDGATTITFPLKVRNLSNTSLTYTPSTTVRRTIYDKDKFINAPREVTTYTGITTTYIVGGSPVTSLTVPPLGETNFNMVLTIGDITVDQTFGEGHLILTPTAGSTISLSIPYVFFVGDYQSVAYQNPASGVTAFADNLVIDPPRDEWWSQYKYTWLIWSTPCNKYGYYLGGNYEKDISRDNIAISPNEDGIQDNLWPVVSFMRNTRDFKVQIRGGSLTTPSIIISERFIRKTFWHARWDSSWKYTPTTLPEGNYFIDYIAEAHPDPSPGDPPTFQTVTFPFKIDLTKPINHITNMRHSGTSISLNWTSSDPSSPGKSGIWGHLLTLIFQNGNIFYSPFLAPSITTYTFNIIPASSYTVVLSTWDYAGNLSNVTSTSTELPPIINASVSPTSLERGKAATLSWSTTNTTSITVTPSLGISPLPLSASATVSPIITTTYIITATGPGGSAEMRVTLTVTEP